jgi:hypothetical protein
MATRLSKKAHLQIKTFRVAVTFSQTAHRIFNSARKKIEWFRSLPAVTLGLAPQHRFIYDSQAYRRARNSHG